MSARSYVAAGAAVLLLGGGLGAAALANAADPTPTPTPSVQPSATTSATPGTETGKGNAGKPGKGGKGMGMGKGMAMGGLIHGDAAKQVAAKLGVDEAKLTEAVKQVAEEMRAKYAGQGQSGTRPDMATMKDEALTSLAQKLGVDKAALTAAIDEVQAAQGAAERAEHRDELKARLDQAVKDGKITQADEDAILKAYDAGVLGGHR